MRPLPALSLAYFGSTADGNTALPAAAGAAAGAGAGAASFFGLASATGAAGVGGAAAAGAAAGEVDVSAGGHEGGRQGPAHLLGVAGAAQDRDARADARSHLKRIFQPVIIIALQD